MVVITTSAAGPGWYHAEGDPERSVRYWNGVRWIGGPQPMTAALFNEGIPFHELYMRKRSRKGYGQR